MSKRKAHPDIKIIERHNGVKELCKKLKYEGLNGYRRVHNWQFRGIPAEVKLDNPWLIDT